MRLLVLAVATLYFLTPNIAVSDELNTEKKAAIKKLLQVSGALRIGEIYANALTQQMSQVLKKAKPDIDPKAFDIVKVEVGALIHEELIEKESLLPYMYPIYHKYLTIEDTRGLIKFYETPLGQKAISVMPKMTQEGMQAGQVWGQSISKKLQQRVSERFKKGGIEM